MVDRHLSSKLDRHCRQLSKDLKLDGGNGNKPGSKKPGSKKGKNKNKGESGEGSKTKGKGKSKSVPKGKHSKKERVARKARKGKASTLAVSDTQPSEPAGSRPKRRKAT